MRYLKSASLLVAAVGLLGACGGGGGGGSSAAGADAFAARFAELNGDPTLVSPTMQTTVDALSGSATYEGILNVSLDDPSNPAGSTGYYGNIAVGVDFDDNSISGEAGDFVQYFSEIASSQTGSAVSGSLDITGDLLPANESAGGGIMGEATGSIDGYDVAYDVEGNITGVSGNGMTLSFDGPDLSGGVAILVD